MLKLGTALATNDNDAFERDDRVIEIAGDPQRFVKLVALGILRGGMHVLQAYANPQRELAPGAAAATAPPAEVMTADEVAAFLGVDRNTVYEYAARGVIPHRRLGKRMIFRRGTIVAWLDSAQTSDAR